MILCTFTVNVSAVGILHVCGGDPVIGYLITAVGGYSPRVWRWSIMSLYNQGWSGSILHVCGGDPLLISRAKENDEYSPRVWRWSYASSINAPTLIVFSTCVEVIPHLGASLASRQSILHVCGGDPRYHLIIYNHKKYSPRVWRWSSKISDWSEIHGVFSTCVEVILIKTVDGTTSVSILHVCGGDPNWDGMTYLGFEYSPRVWRWSRWCDWRFGLDSVFSTCVEVIPRLWSS